MELGKIGRAAQVSLPITVADERRRRALDALLVGGEAAAAEGLDAERFKEAAGDLGDVDAGGLPDPGDGREEIRVLRHLREGVVAGAHVIEVRVGEAQPVALGGQLPQAHDPLRVGVWERAQQDGVHHREDGGGCADAQGQRQHGDGGEACGFGERPQAMSQFAEQGFHPER